MSSGGGQYTRRFYEERASSTDRAARLVLELVFGALGTPRSIVDVGCGNGVWLRAAEDLGVRACVGLDGPWVPKEELLIDPENFRPQNLNDSLPEDLSADILICLEAAEHLSLERAPTLVEELTSMAPIVVFSAAVPGQGGIGHVNEQWQSYWASLFAARGFMARDLVRPAIWSNQDVPFWYRQNLIVYQKNSPGFQVAPESLNLVHPELYELKRDLKKRAFRAGIGTLKFIGRRIFQALETSRS